MKSALEDSINELACAEGDGEDSEDEGGETPQSSGSRASVSNDTGKPAAAGKSTLKWYCAFPCTGRK
jgi:hypothetical protein